MDHFRRIYSSRAADYQAMIAAEDADGQLLSALQALALPDRLSGRRVLDLGSGTGRLPRLLADEAGQIVALDLHAAMLRENAAQRERAAARWHLVQADMGRVPLPSRWADVVTAGWAIGHLRGWHPDDWRNAIGRVLEEMHRVAASGGLLVIMETLTTGSLAPAPPTAELGEYYAWLESEWGFWRRIIRTDYVFASVDEAVARTEFFFGPELSGAIRRNTWARLPEWTGVWSKRTTVSETPR
jgi:ubiquinone/menaquinone biosynthesis C-methylase UbiE